MAHTYQQGQHAHWEEGRGAAQALARIGLRQVLKETVGVKYRSIGMKFISHYECLDGLLNTDSNPRI